MIALGALHYYLQQPSPYKDMIFNPRESIAFNGNTGPYLQYSGARISSMLRKFQQRRERYRDGSLDVRLLDTADEWEIVKLLAAYPQVVALAAQDLNPAVVAGHLHELAKAFSRYYHDHPVLHNPDPNLVVSRIRVAEAVLQVLKNGLYLIGVPFLPKM